MTLAHPTRRPALGAGLLLAAVAALAIGAPALGATIGVGIADKAFAPTGIVVAKGDTVTWTITKAIADAHTVTSGKPGDADAGKLFDSGFAELQVDGDTYSVTFDTPGTYDYFCQVHATVMTGKVVVLGEGQAPAEASAGITPERKLIAVVVIGAALLVLFGAARVWRRMNPA